MRIAYICADVGIPVFGCKGAAVHVQEVLRALLKKGAHIVLFASRIGGPPPADLADVQLVRLPEIPAGDALVRAHAALESNQQLVQALREQGPFDLVYERYSLWSYAGLEYADSQGWKTVLEVNAPLIEEQRNYRQLVAEEQAVDVLRCLLATATAVIAVSPGVKDYLVSFAATAQHIHVIANGVNPQRFACMSRQTLAQAHPGAVVIGFLGTLKPWHGLDTLLQGFALLQAQRPESWLLIVGDGPEKASLMDEVTHSGLISNVVFTGAIDPAAVPQWLSVMDIAVAPYPEMAGFYFSPLKIYEYMAANLPVVASRVGHLDQVICDGNTGLLVEPGNPAALCTALKRLVDEAALRNQLGTAAREHVIQHHSWQVVVEEVLRVAHVEFSGIAK